MIAFAIENKDNYASWGKYEFDELQDAYTEMPEADRASTTGQRIKERIQELESGKDHLKDIRQEAASEYQGDDIEQEESTEEQAEASKNNTPYIIGGIIVLIILLLVLYLF